jgi:hypothetical protein
VPTQAKIVILRGSLIVEIMKIDDVYEIDQFE